MPALRDGVPFGTYVKIDAVNWSTLKLMDQSPLHYHHRHRDRKETPSLRLGRATHALALDPSCFAGQFAVYEGERRAGKAWEAFEAAHAGRDILKADELAEARELATAVREHPLLAPFRADARYEVTATWTDAASGLRCKARPDWLAPGVLLDLKTTRSINALRFRSQAETLGYFGQLAFYRRGLVANGVKVERVLLVAVESAHPYDVGVFEVTEATLQSSDAEVGELLSRLVACRDSNHWPGRYESIQPLDRPEWATGAELTITPDPDDEE